MHQEVGGAGLLDPAETAIITIHTLEVDVVKQLGASGKAGRLVVRVDLFELSCRVAPPALL
jgi:hypothetical protein